MLISELIEFLQKLDPDNEVVVPTAIGTYIKPLSYGIIRVVPVVPGSKYDKRKSYKLAPGNEWREPINEKDEPEAKREWKFIIR